MAVGKILEYMCVPERHVYDRYFILLVVTVYFLRSLACKLAHFLTLHIRLKCLSTIALNVTTKVNCQALYTFNQIFGNSAIGLASVNLSLRTSVANVYISNLQHLMCIAAWLYGHRIDMLLSPSWSSSSVTGHSFFTVRVIIT